MNSENARPHLVISGWHGHDNAGDDATLIQFLAEMGRGTDGAERDITVLSELPDRVEEVFGTERVHSTFHFETVGLHGLTHLLKGRWFGHLALLKRSRLFALGGGSLLRDNTTWHNLFRVLDEIWIAKMFGCRVALYAVGVGPFKTRLGRFLIGLSAKRCDLITVREENSKRALTELGVEADRIHVVADPAFCLEPRPVEDSALLERVRSRRTVGFFPSLGFIEDGDDLSHVPSLAAALDTLHERHDLGFVSIPMRVLPDDIDDVHVTELVRAEMRHPEALYVHRTPLSAAEIKWLTGEFEFNLTVRLHALIFSLSLETPCVAVNYEPKVENVLGSFELVDFAIDMDEGLCDGLVRGAERILEDPQSYREHVAARLPEHQASARSTFERMNALLGRSSS